MAGPLRWRWLLTDEQTGAPLADHRVDLDPGSDEVAAFGDLYLYARQHAAPDRRDTDAARIVASAGEWAGRALLGEQVGAAIAKAAPVTVRVTAPDMAHFPAEPERFVGRAAAMAMASAALAPDSDRSTVLLHGMSGAGKTACALELAYRHQDSFAAAAFSKTAACCWFWTTWKRCSPRRAPGATRAGSR